MNTISDSSTITALVLNLQKTVLPKFFHILVPAIYLSIGALGSPFVKWFLEIKAMRFKERIEIMKKWENIVSSATSFNEIENTELWVEIKKIIPIKEQKNMKTLTCSPGGNFSSGELSKLRVISKYLNKLKHKWKII